MPSYTAPVEDMMFLFEKLRNNKNYNELEKYKDVSPDLVKDILQEAAKINQNLILPLAKAGDENPAVLENGVVRTPPGYKEAYTKYIEDGWTSLSCDPKYGGQGMPKTVSAFFDEMLSSASLSFKLYSELSIGAYNCINHHATDDIKNKYLPKIVEGKWSGTMCLTEPVCGTDLGLLKTKAKKQSDGTYKLTGQKIFITSGDHDLPENIIRDLVLLKLNAVGLRGAQDKMPAELSGGMARRVALARAVALDPDIIMYDEPFAGLDPISMAVICDLIRSLNDALGATSIIVTHDVAETFSFADYIYFLADGTVAAEGSPKQLMASKLPFVKQFIHSEKDGPVPFHADAPNYRTDLRL